MAGFNQPDGSEITEEYENDPERSAINMALTRGDQKRKVLHRVLLGSFGLTLIVQASLNISLRLLYTSTQRDLLTDNCTGDNNVTKDRDRLLISYNQLSEENNKLQTRYKLLRTICNKFSKNEDCQEKICSAEASCPEGWLKFACSCYYVSTEEKTWEASRQDCLNRGADLVIIKSKKENQFLDKLNKDVWLGLTDIEEEGNWRWVDGTPMIKSMSFWVTNQPDSGGVLHPRIEDCAHFQYEVEPDVGWNDISCRALKLWVCEKKLPLP